MILKAESIQHRLRKLDTILKELNKYQQITKDVFQADLSQRWAIEGSLIAATSLILDIADHILGSHFGSMPIVTNKA